MEESVKIAVRWRPVPENDENKNEIILKKLTKNVSIMPCDHHSDWHSIFLSDIILIDKFILCYRLDGWR